MDKTKHWYGLSKVTEIPNKNNHEDYKIEYNGRRCAACVVEDTMYQRFQEDYQDEHGVEFDCDDEEENKLFTEYMQSHANNVYELCDLALFPEHHPELESYDD